MVDDVAASESEAKRDEQRQNSLRRPWCLELNYIYNHSCRLEERSLASPDLPVQFLDVFFPLLDDLSLSSEFFLAHLVLFSHGRYSLEGGEVVFVSYEEPCVDAKHESEIAESLREDGLPAGGLVGLHWSRYNKKWDI